MSRKTQRNKDRDAGKVVQANANPKRDYIFTVAGWSSRYGEAHRAIDQAIGERGTHDEGALSAALAPALESIKGVSQEILAYKQVPPTLGAVHQDMRSMAHRGLTYAEKLMAGTFYRDGSLIQLATEELEAFRKVSAEVTEKLTEMRAKLHQRSG